MIFIFLLCKLVCLYWVWWCIINLFGLNHTKDLKAGFLSFDKFHRAKFQLHNQNWNWWLWNGNFAKIASFFGPYLNVYHMIKSNYFLCFFYFCSFLFCSAFNAYIIAVAVLCGYRHSSYLSPFIVSLCVRRVHANSFENCMLPLLLLLLLILLSLKIDRNL